MRRIRRKSGELRFSCPGPRCVPDLVVLRRPKSENANWEDPPQEGEPFDYNAKPQKFYLDIETVGGLEPDVVMQQGIKVLQQKLAAVIQELAGGDDRTAIDGVGGYGGGRSPDGINGAGGYGMDQGYTTPYGNGGAASTWGGGQTPYGATPYGQRGTPW